MKTEPSSAESLPPSHEKKRFLVRPSRLISEAQAQLGRAQQQYKRSFYARIRPMKFVQIGPSVYLERQGPQETDAPGVCSRHKIQVKADGP